MSDTLTRSERAAIASYDGPVTVCPPRVCALDPAVPPEWRREANVGWKNWHKAQRFRRAEAKAGKPQKPKGPTNAEIHARYAAAARPDRTAAEIAGLLGVHKRTALRMLAKLGLPFRKQMGGRRAGDGPLAPEYRALAKKMTVKQMAAHFGVTQSAVRERLRRLGIQALSGRNRNG